MKLKALVPWKKNYDKTKQHIKKQRHYFADKDPYSQSYGFSSSHVDKSWTIKKAECWRIDAFQLWCWRRLLSVPWTARRIKQVNPKGNQPWIFIGRTYAKAEAPILWSLDVRKANSLKMILMLGNVEGKRRLRATGDKIVEWHHWLNVCEFDQTRGDSEGQGNLCAAVHGVAKSQIQLNDWTTIQTLEYSCKATKKTQIPRFSNISKECSELWWMKWPVNFRVVDKFQC